MAPAAVLFEIGSVEEGKGQGQGQGQGAMMHANTSRHVATEADEYRFVFVRPTGRGMVDGLVLQAQQ